MDVGRTLRSRRASEMSMMRKALQASLQTSSMCRPHLSDTCGCKARATSRKSKSSGGRALPSTLKKRISLHAFRLPGKRHITLFPLLWNFEVASPVIGHAPQIFFRSLRTARELLAGLGKRLASRFPNLPINS